VRFPFLLLAAVLVLPVAPAGAATVSSTTSSFYDPGGKGWAPATIVTRHIALAADAGEANALVVGAEGGVVTVLDVGAPLTPGAGCAAAGGGAVRCPVADAEILALTVALGDGDDGLEISGFGTVVVDAGAGADVVQSAAGGEIDGGEGDDVLSVGVRGLLRGGPGADKLTGSPHGDVLDGGPGTDAMDAGEGIDTLSYAGRPDAVAVDLGAPTAGAPGEDDRVAGFEQATGGEGADVLRVGAAAALPSPTIRRSLRGEGGDDVLEGGESQDVLDGGAGNDQLAGGVGDDYLEGGPGDDALDGGAGADHLVARDGADVADGGPGDDELSDLGADGGRADVFRGGAGDDAVHGTGTADGGPGDDAVSGVRVSGGAGDDRLAGPRTAAAARLVDCGPGRDTLTRPDDRVVLPAGCERVDPWYFGATTLRIPPRVRGRVVTVRLPQPCLFAYASARCRVKAVLFAGGRGAGTRQARWRRYAAPGRVLRWTLPRRPRPGAVLRLRLVKYETDEATERGGFSVRLR
jgi:Ca2+-binding RTX toxin-like protein